MRILFDQGTPIPLRQSLTHHEVSTAYERGWSRLKNGELLGLTPTYIMLDVAAVVLMAIGGSSFAYQHDWIPESLRFDGYGLVLIVAGVALMSIPGFAFLKRAQDRHSE